MGRVFKENDKVLFAKKEDYSYVFGVVEEVWGEGAIILFRVTDYGTLIGFDRPLWEIGTLHELPTTHIYHSVKELKEEYISKQLAKQKEENTNE